MVEALVLTLEPVVSALASPHWAGRQEASRNRVATDPTLVPAPIYSSVQTGPGRRFRGDHGPIHSSNIHFDPGLRNTRNRKAGSLGRGSESGLETRHRIGSRGLEIRNETSLGT